MSILIVDDSKLHRNALQAMLEEQGYRDLRQAPSAVEALDYLQMHAGVDLVLLDVEMPDIDGIKACAMLKSYEHLADVPVIMITSREDTESVHQAFEAGAMDYITKPPRPLELAVRVGSALKLKREMDRRKMRENDLLQLTRKLGAANQMLRQLAVIDALTELANRRYFDEMLEKEWGRARRSGRAVGLVLADIDNFKLYNDSYGHQAGDECLRRVAAALHRGVARPGDLAARYGGEEFALVLPGADLEGAARVGERVRLAVAEAGIPHRAVESGFVSISAGVASLRPDEAPDGPESLVTVADRRLYQAKAQGRNRVSADDPPPA